MSYNVGDTITQQGVVYTFNGTAWTYERVSYPYTVTTSLTYVGTPVPDLPSELEAVTMDIPNLQDTYDWEILSRLAMGAIYANEVQVSY